MKDKDCKDTKENTFIPIDELVKMGINSGVYREEEVRRKKGNKKI